MDRIKEMTEVIERLSGKYSAYQIFSDWVELMAMAITNSCSLFHNKVWKEREEQYVNIQSKYSEAEFENFYKLFALLVEELEENPSDVLGTIFMRGGFGSGQAGQFFTPFNISMLIARLSIRDLVEKAAQQEKIHINEPSCGGGGMIIAVAVVLQEKGIAYQNVMEVVAQDLDWRGVYMCYVQLSLLGISAEVVQGDTIADPYTGGNFPERRILRTPKKVGMLL